MSKFSTIAFFLLLLGSPALHAADHCEYDEQALLALDEDAFDQDISGGWRAVASIPGCELAAAGLLATYRAKHANASTVLAWHEGQMRASAGQYEQAIPLLEAARKPLQQEAGGWNHYVDATLAFLRHDNPALLAARKRLAAVAYTADTGMPPLKDGYFELPVPPGQPAMKMRWPPNIDVVDGLVACFSKPYAEAYGASCRPPSP